MKSTKIRNTKRLWEVLSFKVNLWIGRDEVEAYSKYEAKQKAKSLHPTATEFKIKEIERK